MERQGYPTDLTDAAWALLGPHLPSAWPSGRPRVHGYRAILNARCYPVRGGCASQEFALSAAVHEANIAERDGLTLLLREEATADQPVIRERFPRLTDRRRDGGYNGAGPGEAWVEQALGWTVDVMRHLRRPRGVWADEGEVIDWAWRREGDAPQDPDRRG